MASLQDGVSVNVSSLAVSTSIAPSTVEHGIGSDAGRCLMVMGDFLQEGVHAVLIRRRLSSIKAQLRGSNCGPVANDEKICDHLLELSRRGLYPAKVKREAWGMICFILSEGEIQGLLNALVKWGEIEIQIFIQDAVKQMPADWIFDPLSHNRASEAMPKTFPELQDNSGIAIGFLRLLASLMQNGHLAKKEKDSSKRHSPTFTLSSFVSASGKMVLGVSVFAQSFKIHINDHALPDIVKAIVCGRLNTISTRLRVEVASYEPSKEMTGLFSELLLIYRLFPEDRTVCRQTRELLFISVSRYHAVALSSVLSSWTREELSLLLAEFASWMVPFVYAGCVVDHRYPKAYRAYLASHPNTRHPILPFLYFLVHLVHSSETAACLLLDLDVIKMLKLLCIHDFPNPAASVISTSLRMDRIALSDVYASLILLFAALSSHPKSCARMLRGRNIPFWFLSAYYTPDFLGLPSDLLLQKTWKEMELSATKLVLVTLEHVLKQEDVRDNVDFLPLKDIYRDIISVLRDPSSQADMLYSAADSLLTCIEFSGDFRKILNSILGEGRVEDTALIIKTAVKGLAPDFHPFRCDGRPLRSKDVHRYLSDLAHAYTSEFRMFSPLVDELFSSPSCDTTYTLPRSGRYSPIVFRRTSLDSDTHELIMNH